MLRSIVFFILGIYMIFMPAILKADWIWDTLQESDFFLQKIFDKPMVVDSSNTYHLIFHSEMSKGNTSGTVCNTYTNVYYMYKACGEDWSQPEKISLEEHSPYDPRLHITEEGKLVVTYYNVLPNDDVDAAYIVEKTDAGWTHEELPLDLDNLELTSQVDTDGNLHMAWITMNENMQRELVYATNMGEQWNISVIPDANPKASSRISLEVSPDGFVHILYTAIGAEHERLMEYIRGNPEEDVPDWTIKKTFTYPDEYLLKGYLNCFDDKVHVVLAIGDMNSLFSIVYIDYYTLQNEEWSEAIRVNHASFGEPVSFSTDHHGNFYVVYRENNAHGNYGTLVISKKEFDEEYFQDSVFEETEEYVIDDVYHIFDYQGNEILLVETEFPSDIYALRSGECAPPAYTVSFEVVDEQDQNIQNAVITLGDHQNQAGDYVFDDVQSDTLAYSVSKAGYQQAEGMIVIADEDVHETVILEADEDYVGLEVPQNMGATIFPNPASSILNIDSKDLIYQVSLVGLSGQVIKNAYPCSNRFQLDVSTLKTGVYIVFMKTDTGVSRHKLHISP